MNVSRRSPSSKRADSQSMRVGLGRLRTSPAVHLTCNSSPMCCCRGCGVIRYVTPAATKRILCVLAVGRLLWTPNCLVQSRTISSDYRLYNVLHDIAIDERMEHLTAPSNISGSLIPRDEAPCSSVLAILTQMRLASCEHRRPP